MTAAAVPDHLDAATSWPKLRFDNSFVRELPGDGDTRRGVRSVQGACFSRILPVPVGQPALLAHSPEVARLLGLTEADCASETFVRVFAGNALVPGMEPYAACYGGHQFGTWAGQLGDGRAITLGEILNDEGQRWELQLKGAGPTPYSRSADGRAVLRSSLREFLCSEAMHHLGVPTTRALSLVVTPDRFMRDILYDGHPRLEPGAVVCRVAPSFVRFGNFEIFAARDDAAVLRRLADYVLHHHFPDIERQNGASSKAAYLGLLTEVCRRTAILMAHWLKVGFVHGVMNTDNMSILGLTIDYGPFGFLDHFAADFTPNTTDAAGRRYCFANQARVANWNLVRLAEALFPLVGEVGPLKEALAVYSQTYETEQDKVWAGKLGLPDFAAAAGADKDLVDELFAVMSLVETDMAIFFRGLAEVPVHFGPQIPDDVLLAPIAGAYYAPELLRGTARERTIAWLRRYAARVRQLPPQHSDQAPDGITAQTPAQASDVKPTARQLAMNRCNPKYVLRNYLAQLAIDAAESGDGSAVTDLLDVLRHPYDEQPGRERFAAKRPDWARERVGCSMLSCSS